MQKRGHSERAQHMLLISDLHKIRVCIDCSCRNFQTVNDCSLEDV